MKIVADTNTFLAVALFEPERDTLIHLTAGHTLTAPRILSYELGNALSAMMKKQTLAPDELLAAWEAVKKIPVMLQDIEIASALTIVRQFNLYAYDAYFLECALSLRAPLLTLDRPLKKVARQLGICVLE